MSNKYWDIDEILRYQRNFNLINGERSIGKTYTTLKKFITQFKKKGCEFVYIVRTQDEKQKGIFEEALKKVIINEFPDDVFEFTTEDMFLVQKDESGTVIERTQVGYCLALSECVKIKKRAFPKVKYGIMDEYMLENNTTSRYVNGWKEPDLLLSIYHTIDREEDRVIFFLMGNNTAFYNPYHLHKAFNIPPTPKGKIWKGENVLFQYAEAKGELKEEKSKCKFLRMIAGTAYGSYAKDGEYSDDNINLVEKMTVAGNYVMTIQYQGLSFGVYNTNRSEVIYISDKIDKTCPKVFAFTLDDHSENTLLTKGRQHSHLKWLAQCFKLGKVRYVSMEVKIKSEKAILMLL